MAYNIFLSHNSADQVWVKWIKDNANFAGIGAYLHEHDSQPGRNLAAKIKQRIDACDALVVLLTRSSQSSAYVHQEIGYAAAKRRVIIPLVQPGTGANAFAMLDGIEYIPFDFDNPKQALTILVRHLLRLRQAKEQRQALLAFAAIIVGALTLAGGS